MSLPLTPLDHRVELRGLLGAGGMGEVHRAWDAALARPVAVKFLRGQDLQGEERLLLEARLQARVDHPNVVQVHEVGTLKGRPCIVLQLVEGRSLAELARGLTVEEKVELLRQAAAGLHAAHRQGLVHRDIKPGNVLVEELATGRRALVTDFGLARAEDAGLSRSGQPPGTLDFMSPEQLLGPGPADFRSDIYALGATLYATLAGRPPFRSATPEQDEDRQVLVRIAEDDPPPLPAPAPRELSVIAARAMEKDPASRYPTAEAFGEDLGRFQRGEPIQARPPTLAMRARKWSRRNRGLARAVVVATAAVLLAGGHALWTARRATLAALDAARLGALSESLAAELRMEFRAPPLDLRPARARLRTQVDALRPGAANGGPASFALGKGLQLLGEWEGARGAFQRAWDTGLQTPAVAEGLGKALGALYRQGRELAVDTLPPGKREERVHALQAELRDPSVRMLERGGVSGWRAESWAATVALLEENFPAARDHAARVLVADPGRYEALALDAEAWLGDATQRSMKDDGEGASAALVKAETSLTRALEFGRSDPQLAADLVQLHAARMQQLTKRALPLEAEAAALSAALQHLSLLDPDDSTPFLMRGDAALRRAQNLLPAAILPLADEALGQFRRAAELRPGDPRSHSRIGSAAVSRAYALQELGQLDAALAAAREGLTSLDRASGLAPMDARTEVGRMMLLATEAGVLRHAGRPAGDVLRAAVAAGERCMELDPRRTRQVKSDLGDTLVELGREDWLAGQDPRPSLRRGLTLAEKAARPGPLEKVRLASNYDAAAAVLAGIGDDFRPWHTRAVALTDEVLRSIPTHTDSMSVKGEVLADAAWFAAQRGDDPRPGVPEAARWLEKAAAAGERGVELQEAKALLPLSEATWLATHGGDPTPRLVRAEQVLASLLAERPDEATALGLLAECARVRATWLKHRGLPAADEARKGVAKLDVAMAHQPRDPLLWVLRARLLVLAEDTAHARESLEHAVAMNALVREAPLARQARAELGP
ncbi:MAG: protein kinase domain-containing protein [Myxococcaceae bacterium]